MTELETKLSKVSSARPLPARRALSPAGEQLWRGSPAGAASYINTATSTGEASALITRTARYVITNNIEAPHYDKEEKLKEQGWEFAVSPWYESSQAFTRLSGGLRVGADVSLPGVTDLSAQVAELRLNLLPEEQTRFREVARLSAQAMDSAVRAVRPGMNEYEIAADWPKRHTPQAAAHCETIATMNVFGFRIPAPARI